jgi:FkbM family methyltransferase
LIKNLCFKITIFRKLVEYVSNWHVFCLVYFGFFSGRFYVLKLRNGLQIKLRTNSTDIQAFVNVWLQREYAKEKFEIHQSDTIIDVGGHVGLFSVYAAYLCKSGVVFSFEPDGENFRLLEENIALNKLENIKSFNLAVSSKIGKVKIYQNKCDQAAHTIFGTGKNFVEVKALSLQEIFESNSIVKCNLLKLDCEGAEYEILGSLPEEYFKKIDRICLEYHPIENSTVLLHNLKTHLDKLGYKIMDYPMINGLGLLFAYR